MQYMKQYISHRRENGLNKDFDMAKELGVDKVVFSRMKSGSIPLSRKRAESMAQVTGLKPSYWLGLHDVEKYEGWK